MVDSSGDEVVPQMNWDTQQSREGSFIQKKVDHDDKVITPGEGKRKAKRDRKRAIAGTKVRTIGMGDRYIIIKDF